MNIHFSEFLLIVIIALLVIKPENLPKVAKTFGRIINSFKQTIKNIKTQIEKTD